PLHAGVGRFVQDLNQLYRREAALHELDFDPEGFAWIDANDSEQSILSFRRRSRTPGDEILAAFNFTPVPRFGYRLGAPGGGVWRRGPALCCLDQGRSASRGPRTRQPTGVARRPGLSRPNGLSPSEARRRAAGGVLEEGACPLFHRPGAVFFKRAGRLGNQ